MHRGLDMGYGQPLCTLGDQVIRLHFCYSWLTPSEAQSPVSELSLSMPTASSPTITAKIARNMRSHHDSFEEQLFLKQ
jgi:hypothetical protein